MSKPPFLTLPPCARAYRLTTGRGEFAVHDARPAGAPRGTVLLVPGFTGSKEDFIALLEPLAAAGYRAVAVDGRGQHESPGPRDEAAYAQEELARDVHAQAAALGGDGVHLLGHSLGGLIARAAVLADPSPFRSLTVMSSGPGAISPSQQARTRLLIGALGVLGMGDVWQEMQRENTVSAESAENATVAGTPPELAVFLYRRWMGTVPEQLMATGRQLTVEPDRTAELAGVPLPKHVVSGELDYAWPVPEIDAMAKELSARRTVVQGAGHSPNAERPAETAEALLRFWDLVQQS
ncbi:alpha/beta hydrolase [Streptomyces sp. SCA3-4]|uniref:alpha/beta fold hydrolase n=1 Tax=Streptomyces sichuanensis TaxID=2871810 RepID=UPI001CE3463B|nr:alpha/beta hydrolase [Streptomyces sichuanensis]MCA6096307.1 alpha/beta hydrolase [Streptomyces sichuanensis]